MALILRYNNQATMGQPFEQANTFIVGNFVSTGYISDTDFRNQSLNTISISSNSQTLADYLSAAQGLTQFPGGPPSGGVAPFYLIAHPTTVITPALTKTTYEYDGCRFQCYATSGGSGHLMGYRHNTQTYDFQPTYAGMYGHPLELTGNIPLERIKTVRWVGWWDNANQKVGALRPLYTIDVSGLGWGLNASSSQYFYGPLVPSSTVDAWFAEIVQQENPDEPNDPQDEPTDEGNVTPGAGLNWTWLNTFKIMDYTGPWPNKLVVDTPTNADAYYWYNNYNDYLAWNDSNDQNNNYHIPNGSMNNTIGFYQAFDTIVSNIVNETGQLCSNLFRYKKVSNNSGEFIDYMSRPVWNYTDFYGSVADACTFVINNDMTVSIAGTNTLNGITISNNSSSFNIGTNYPNFAQPGYIGFSMPLYCYDVGIIRYQNHYYLGGLIGCYNNQNYGVRAGFGIICRIDKLKEMPGYGGPDPDDPGNVTGDGIDPNDTFNTTGYGPNPSTDQGINNSTGDGTAPIDPGLGGPNGNGGLGSPGYYDDDGTYHAPDGTVYGPNDPDNPRNKGTGEKQSNPVNTSTVTNTHDGSVGNGTGDPHGKDTQVTDPGTTLPSSGSTGTVSGSGFLSVFTPTQAELDDFCAELLDTSVLNSIKQYFSSNPMDGIFGLHIVPYTGFAGSTVANPKIGSYDFTHTCTLADTEYLNVDYGSMYIDFVYDGYENFAPQSDAKIFLPFIGMKDIDINLIQGCNISLKYNVSLTTGDIYAYLYAQWAGKYQQAGTIQGVDHLLYHWQGNCAVNIPLSHVDCSNYISGAMQIAGGITSLAAGAIAGSPFTIPSGITGVTQGIAEMGRSSLITSGNISGVAAFMGSREPYLLISRPLIDFDNQYNHYLGRKSNAIARIGALNEGSFTIMRNVDLSGVGATNDEMQMIEGFLKGGFYV